MREMKDSGVEWIGEIGADFDLIKLKNVADILDEYRKPISADVRNQDAEVLYDYYGASGIIDKIDGYTIDDHVMLIGEDGANLLSRNLPLMYEVNGKAWINNHAHILKPKEETDFYYLFYVLESLDITMYISGSAQPKLNQESLKNIYIPMPPYHKQKAIANYIHERGRILDRVIAKQQAIIEKLKEYKLSIIAEGVTKGIDCKAEFKDSGIEWIGKIPKHWTVTKMKQVALFFNGDRSSKYPSGEDIVDEGVFFITSNNLGEIVLDTSIETNKYITHSKYQELGGAKIRMNDIIFCLRGSVGKCAINKSITEGTIASSLVDIRATGINPDFLNMILHTTGVTAVASVKAIGIGSLNLAAKDISEVVIPLPPAKEAEEIAERLSNKTAEIDKKISIHEKLINKLNDFKRSLIYEMVSGKKQVL